MAPQHGVSWISLGRLQADILGDIDAARQSYEKALELPHTESYAKLSLAFLLRDYLGALGEANGLVEECKDNKPNDITIALHRSIFAIYDNNWGEATLLLKEALGLGLEFSTLSPRDDWYRAAAVFLHLGFGEPFLGVLESHGDSLLPYKEAVRAHVIGDRAALRNIEPEAQTVAGMIFDEIEKRGAHLPEKTRGIAARIS